MTKLRKITTAFLLVAILLTSCTAQESTPDSMDVQNQINAAVAQTLSALTTKVAEVQKTDEAKPTATTAPTATQENTVAPTAAAQPAAQAAAVKPTNTLAPGKCTDYASYVGDITIPDGTMVPPGTQFVKTWAVRNAGSCTWTSDYSLVWIGANQMSAPNRVPLTTENILPGQTAHVSVTLTAPQEIGSHVFSQWKLMNKNGQVFGIMDNKGKEQSIWSEIYVGKTYNFIANACSATWTSSAGVLPCPGTKNDPRGFMYINTAPAIEGGIKENDPAIVMVPPKESNSFIVGQFPPIVVPEYSNLIFHFGCLEGYTKCNFRFRLTYSIEGGEEQELVNRVHGFGEWEEISIKLTQNNQYGMTGKATSFLFYIYPMEGSSDNYAFIFSPIITP
ncbi:NBR1-Ig-like domain-containing protein [Leptolinea tardivitalis]|uniref:NBR1-Ig-like domain-containing protein n=1 Tax=Leptolinea tardivitalis TaxID=229920 RepID=UPI0007823C92|nr:NBR1-Ig-like domain-containing protein [Leptolinea tardivitalis]GAP21157.1 hypothetical protein LTAR_01365 [Leptolinea tardivitalis]